MQDLGQAGIEFFREVFRNYWGDITLWAVYLAFAFYSFWSRDKLYKYQYGYGTIMAILTIFNPLAVGWLVKLCGLQERYYRFYWIIPAAPLIGIFFAGTLQKRIKLQDRIMALIAAAVIIALCGNFKIYEIEDKKANIYKINEEVIEITELIHEYAPEMEIINAYYGNDILVEIRTYDASIHTPIGRYERSALTEIEGMEEQAREYNNGYLLVLMEYEGIEFPAERVASAFDEYGINCYIRKKTNFSDAYVSSLGLTLIGQTEGYEVYWYK